MPEYNQNEIIKILQQRHSRYTLERIDAPVLLAQTNDSTIYEVKYIISYSEPGNPAWALPFFIMNHKGLRIYIYNERHQGKIVKLDAIGRDAYKIKRIAKKFLSARYPNKKIDISTQYSPNQRRNQIAFALAMLILTTCAALAIRACTATSV
jgi:hypothetical protein